MREMFPGFYYQYPTGENLSKLWQEAIFIFDTNMLLNVYRYSPEALNRYFEILARLQEQIWVPYQVAYEYHASRVTVIQGYKKRYDDVVSSLDSIAGDLKELMGKDTNKHFIDQQALTKNILDEIDKSKKVVTERRKQDKKVITNLLEKDVHRDKLEELLQNKIGKPYYGNKLQEVYRYAEQRFDLEMPPGWMDRKSKKDFKQYGDVLLWFQIIDYAKIQQKPIIFITDDVKKDWWVVKEDKKIIQPLPDLIQEMFNEANSLLYVYQGYNFLENATKVLNLKENPEIIEEAKEVTQQNIRESQAPSMEAFSSFLGFQAESAVGFWLEEKYPFPDFQVIQNPRIAFEVDFIIIAQKQKESNFKPKGVIVKFSLIPHNFFSRGGFLATFIEGTFQRVKANYDEVLLFLITPDLETTNKLVKVIQMKYFNLPEGLTLIMGYLENSRFTLVSVLP